MRFLCSGERVRKNKNDTLTLDKKFVKRLSQFSKSLCKDNESYNQTVLFPCTLTARSKNKRNYY